MRKSNSRQTQTKNNDDNDKNNHKQNKTKSLEKKEVITAWHTQRTNMHSYSQFA